MICSGGDLDASVKAAGHRKETKARYYKLRGSAGVVWEASSSVCEGMVKIINSHVNIII